MAVFNTHYLTLRRLSSHSLHLRRARLLEAGTIGTSSNKAFGPVLFVETEVVNQLFLDLEGLAAFFTLVPLQVKVGPLVILESQQIVVAFLAHQAAENTSLMGLFVVKEGAGVSVSSSTLVTLMGFVTLVNHWPPSIATNITASSSDSTTNAISSRHPFGSIQALLLAQ